MKPLTTLTDRCCRWPVGPSYPPGQMHRQLWCGAPRATGDWFCPVHMRDAFPRARLTAAQVKSRNLVTIKLALMRRRPAVSREEMLEDLHHNADLIGRQPMACEIEAVMSAPESEEVAALRTRLIDGGEAAAASLPVPEVNSVNMPHGHIGLRTGADPMPQNPASNDAEKRGTLRPIRPLAFPTFDATNVPTAAPLIEWMAPSDLLVEAAYQRDLSPKSMDLIKRIAERWDWRRFKPPIVAWSERGFEIIDGQHTAIGAATRGIDRIPVLVVEATDLTDRASAFVGHNQDRLAITPVQMHQAKLAAGDEDALTAQQVIDRAGAKLVVGAYGARGWKPGETVAITTIDQLAKRRGAMHARRVIEVLVKAFAAPVSASGIKAVDMLMFRPEFADIDLEHLPAAIISAGDVEKEAKLDAKTHGITAWEAMGRIWFRKCRKIRKAA